MSTIHDENLNTFPINVSASGDYTVHGAMAYTSDQMVIDFISLIAGGSVTVQFYDGASTNNKPLSGPIPLVSGQSLTWENSMSHPKGVLTATPGNNIVLNLNASVQIGGMSRYREIGN